MIILRLRNTRYIVQTYKNFNSKFSSTIDKNEIDHFQKCDKWWDPKGEMQVLHSMNEIRVPFIRDSLIASGNVSKETQSGIKILKGIEILDVGCGGGFLTEGLARLGANVTGIDASLELINVAKKHVENDPKIKNSIRYEYTTIEEHANKFPNKYDAVVASEIIEHVTEKELFLKSCVTVLKPGASIFVSTFNKTYLSWLGGIIAAEYVFKLISKGTHNWNKFIPPHEVQRILEENNCTTKVVHGTFYNLLTHKWKLISTPQFHYILHAVKQNNTDC